MATVNELYRFLENAIPAELACEWDNDGRMCVPSPEKEVKKALICLDISESAVEYAAENGFDCIISHHPLIFSPIKKIDCEDHLCRKLCKLIKNNIAAFSFHTRLDKVSGGVNDALADIFGMRNITDFSDVGRMGEYPTPLTLRSVAALIKEWLNTDRSLICVDGGKLVKKIAVVGGSGKGYLEEAVKCGCDTLITGEMPFNSEHDAKEMGINLICAGHYFTENIVCNRLEMLVNTFNDCISTEIYNTNPSFSV